MTYVPGPTSLIPDKDLATATARQRLATVKTTDPAASTVDAVRVGRAVKLTMTEMERVTGFSRKSLYNNLEKARETEPSSAELELEILMVLASEDKHFPASTIAALLDVAKPGRILSAMDDLAADGRCEIKREPNSTSIVGRATDSTFLYLRKYFDSIYFRRPDAYMVNFDARGHDPQQLVAALNRVLSNPEDYALMGREVKPATMAGPELGFYVYASTVPRVFEIARKVWKEMMQDETSEPPIREVLPPSGKRPQPSDVLDSFLNELIAVDPTCAEQVTDARDTYIGGADKVDLAGRCVRQAARAMRRAREIEEEPGRIYDGDSAWTEVEIAEAIELDPPYTDLQVAAKKAVWLASDNLGYFPGGGIASMGKSSPVTGSNPTNAQLIEMAGVAGTAVGEASKLNLLGPVEAMLEIVRPDFGATA